VQRSFIDNHFAELKSG